MRLMRMSGVRGITAVLLMVVGADAWGLDPTWVSLTPMPTARRRPAVTAIGGTIYVVGGYDGPAYATILAVVEAYDTATGTWTTKAPLPVPTYGAAGASVGGTVYVMGGLPWTGFNGYSATLWAYDPATDTWTAKTPMTTKRGMLVATTWGGLVYAIGGGNGLTLPNVEVYDPATNSWSTRTPMPTARDSLTTAASMGAIWASGGEKGSILNTVEAYDVVSNVWTSKAGLPTPLVDSGATSLGGFIYAIGGEGPDNVYNDTVYAYNPFSDTWTTKASMPTARDELGVVAIGSTIYAIGGGATCDGCAAYNIVEAGWVPPGAISCTLSLSPSAQHVGRWFTATLTVGNPGEFVMASLVPSLWIDSGAGLVGVISGPVPSGTPYLPPGWTQTFTWTFSASGVGTAGFTATVTGYDLASCTTMLVASSADVSLEPRIEEPPPPANPLLLGYPGAALDRNAISLAQGEVVLARIAPRDGSPMTVRVYTASGRLVRTLVQFTAMDSGQWQVSWNGRTEDEKPVSRGVYVVRVTGGGLDERLKVVVR